MILTLIKDLGVIKLEKDKRPRRFCLVKCHCGVTFKTRYDYSHKLKSCGCHHNGKTNNPLYNVWSSMKQRCNNPNSKSYPNYGGRGIKVCAAWKDSNDFISWAEVNGYKKGLQLDRVNNDLGYSPCNCRFVDSRTNNLNSRRIRSNNASGYRGVSKKRDKWSAKIVVSGQAFNLGSYPNKKDAVLAREVFIDENNLPPAYSNKNFK